MASSSSPDLAKMMMELPKKLPVQEQEALLAACKAEATTEKGKAPMEKAQSPTGSQRTEVLGSDESERDEEQQTVREAESEEEEVDEGDDVPLASLAKTSKGKGKMHSESGVSKKRKEPIVLSESDEEESTEQNPSLANTQTKTPISKPKILFGNPSAIGKKRKKGDDIDVSKGTQVPFAEGSPTTRTRSATPTTMAAPEPERIRSRPKMMARKKTLTKEQREAIWARNRGNKGKERLAKEAKARKEEKGKEAETEERLTPGVVAERVMTDRKVCPDLIIDA